MKVETKVEMKEEMKVAVKFQAYPVSAWVVMENIVKPIIRKSLYKLLERSSELDSPWGILTGVRPMKIIHELINENLSSEQIRLVLKDEYLLNKEKRNKKRKPGSGRVNAFLAGFKGTITDKLDLKISP